MRGRPPTRRGRGKGKKFGVTPPDAPSVTDSDSESEQQSPHQSQQPASQEPPSESEDSEMVGPSQPIHHASESEPIHHASESESGRSASRSASRSSSRSASASQPPPIPTRMEITQGEVQDAIVDLGAAGKGKQPRKKRPPVTISEEQEAAALEFLKEHTLLYDRSLKEYKDVSRREKLWEELADQLSTDRNPIKRDDIKKWFESQRTIFGKCTKLVSGQAAKPLSERKKWVVTQFDFLAGHISRQPSRGSTLKQAQSQTESMEAQPASQTQDVDSDSDHPADVSVTRPSRALERSDAGAGPSQTPARRSSDASPPPNSSNSTSKRRRVVSPAQQSDVVERLLATSAEKQRNEDELRERLLHPDPRRAFCDFIAASVKDIDETLWDTFVHETFTLLSDFKRRTRSLSLPPPPPPPPAVVPQVRLQATSPAGTSTPTYQQQPQSVFQQVPPSFGYPQQPGPIYAPTQQLQQQQQQVQLQQQQIQQLQQQLQLQQQAPPQVNIGKPAYVTAPTPPQVTLILPVAGAPLAGAGAMNNPSLVPRGSGPTNNTQAGGSGTATHNTSSGSLGSLGKMIANYTDSDCPLSVGQMNTPNYMHEDDKDEQ